MLHSFLNLCVFAMFKGDHMKTKDELPECPVATTVSLIGSKWKLLIMRNLLARPWRFNELKKSLQLADLLAAQETSN